MCRECCGRDVDDVRDVSGWGMESNALGLLAGKELKEVRPGGPALPRTLGLWRRRRGQTGLIFAFVR